MGRPVGEWLAARGIAADELGRTDDLQAARLFPVCDSTDEVFDILEWMLSEQPDPALPALTRAFGSVFPGTLSAMARENTMRNPGRTSATGTAIIIGVTLVVTIIVGAASVRTTLTNAVKRVRK